VKKSFSIFILVFSLLMFSCATTKNVDKTNVKETKKVKKSEFNYPKTERKIVKDNYFGTIVEDPYRWLEDSKNPKVIKWTEAQNAFTKKTIFSFKQTGKFYNILKKLVNQNINIYYDFAFKEFSQKYNLNYIYLDGESWTEIDFKEDLKNLKNILVSENEI